MKYYFRIGELPRDGRSKIYQWDNEEHTSRSIIGEEIGISAYEMEYDPMKRIWKVFIPKSSIAIDTVKELFKAVGDGEKRFYVIGGDRIGTGSDGEPLLDSAKITIDVTEYPEKFSFTHKGFIQNRK